LNNGSTVIKNVLISADLDVVRKVIGAQIKIDKILERFKPKLQKKNDKESPNEVAAFYIYEDLTEVCRPLLTDYLSFKELTELILARKFRGRSGIIQKYTHPFLENESGIQAQWTTKLCIIETRKNKNKFRDKTINKLNRCATFDAPFHISTRKNLSSNVSVI